jgi:hypothetical protein
MAKDVRKTTITHKGTSVRRGDRMTKGAWRLVKVSGEKTAFVGSLVTTINIGDQRLAVFSVPKT